MVYEGIITIISQTNDVIIGSSYDLVERVTFLELKVADLQEQVNNTPEGTDFLIPEDIQPLFSGKEVIYDV